MRMSSSRKSVWQISEPGAMFRRAAALAVDASPIARPNASFARVDWPADRASNGGVPFERYLPLDLGILSSRVNREPAPHARG